MFVSIDCQMKSLKRSRTVTLYLPNDYFKENKKYPVLYINDGQNAFFDQLSYCGISWGFLDYVQDHQIDVIMVAIPCNFEGFKRMDEYGPWPVNKELSYQETHIEDEFIGGEGKAYVKWMIEELKPYIDAHYRTIPDDCGIVGSSMGGVISAYAALEYPHIFTKCAALSTAFWFYMEEFIELINQHEYHHDFQFYFDLGEFEGCGDEEIDRWYKETNDEIYSILKDKVKQLEYHYFEGATHNEEEWRKRVPLFMEFFYRRR